MSDEDGRPAGAVRSDAQHAAGDVADYVSQLPDEQREDRAALESVAMDTSGAVSALRTLESVAADGREWIVRERERTRRQIEDYIERVGGVA
jgi:hypothetical protein